MFHLPSISIQPISDPPTSVHHPENYTIDPKYNQPIQQNPIPLTILILDPYNVTISVVAAIVDT